MVPACCQRHWNDAYLLPGCFEDDHALVIVLTISGAQQEAMLLVHEAEMSGGQLVCHRQLLLAPAAEHVHAQPSFLANLIWPVQLSVSQGMPGI